MFQKSPKPKCWFYQNKNSHLARRTHAGWGLKISSANLSLGSTTPKTNALLVIPDKCENFKTPRYFDITQNLHCWLTACRTDCLTACLPDNRHSPYLPTNRISQCYVVAMKLVDPPIFVGILWIFIIILGTTNLGRTMSPNPKCSISHKNRARSLTMFKLGFPSGFFTFLGDYKR